MKRFLTLEQLEQAYNNTYENIENRFNGKEVQVYGSATRFEALIENGEDYNCDKDADLAKAKELFGESVICTVFPIRELCYKCNGETGYVNIQVFEFCVPVYDEDGDIEEYETKGYIYNEY